MRYSFEILIIVLLSAPACNKGGATRLCVQNNTTAAFNKGGSFVGIDYDHPVAKGYWDRTDDLAKGAENCFVVHDVGPDERTWYGIAMLNYDYVGEWKGKVVLQESEDNHIVMSDANKTYDFRDSIAGDYHFRYIRIVTVNGATVYQNEYMITGTVEPDPQNFLSLLATVPPYFDGKLSFTTDRWALSTANGEGEMTQGYDEIHWKVKETVADSTIYHFFVGQPQ